MVAKKLIIKSHKGEDTPLRSKDVWKLWKEWSDRTKRIKSIMITSTIGRKEKNKEDLKVNCYRFGDSTIRKRRNTLHQYAGTRNTRIFLLFLSVVTILQSKKQVKFLSGHWKTSHIQNTNMKVYQQELCVLIGILLHLLYLLQVYTMEQF